MADNEKINGLKTINSCATTILFGILILVIGGFSSLLIFKGFLELPNKVDSIEDKITALCHKNGIYCLDTSIEENSIIVGETTFRNIDIKDLKMPEGYSKIAKVTIINRPELQTDNNGIIIGWGISTIDGKEVDLPMPYTATIELTSNEIKSNPSVSYWNTTNSKWVTIPSEIQPTGEKDKYNLIYKSNEIGSFIVVHAKTLTVDELNKLLNEELKK